MPCGGASAAVRVSVARSKGLCGAIQGANSAAARQTKSTNADTIATGERRNPYARSASHQRARRVCDATLVMLLTRNQTQFVAPAHFGNLAGAQAPALKLD